MKPTVRNNFGRVFELPNRYPREYCFGGGQPVQFLMVDWFNPLKTTDPPEPWEEAVKTLRPFLMQKSYVKPGRRYILITDFGETLMFGHDL